MMIKFSIVITTKNRLEELRFTLNTLSSIINRTDVELLICDDASYDGTNSFLRSEYPKAKLFTNKTSKGLIHNRNLLNNSANGDYIISLDDDANFLSKNPLDCIEDYFNTFKDCVVLSFAIYWSKVKPINIINYEVPYRVNSFAGGAHAIKKEFWEISCKYPDWFKFYGEEDYLSYFAFKKNKQIHYLPTVLTHHRVDVKGRKNHKDYITRVRRAIRSVWFLYFIYYPIYKIPKLIVYTFYVQFKNKVVKGDFKVFFGLFLAFLDLIFYSLKNYSVRKSYSSEELLEYSKLKKVNLYWKPKQC